MGKRIAGLFIFRRKNSNVEYLILEPSNEAKLWSPPKGRVDPGEEAFVAALRETKEETGYTEDDLIVHQNQSIIKMYPRKNGKKKEVIYWLAELKNGQKDPVLDDDEHVSYRWLTKDETISICTHKEFDETVNEFDDKIRALASVI